MLLGGVYHVLELSNNSWASNFRKMQKLLYF